MHQDPAINESEFNKIKERLVEAEETLAAIRDGAVDAVIVKGEHGPKVFALQSADHPYRIMIEAMNEGAVTLTSDGSILYCNRRFAEMVWVEPTRLLGRCINDFILKKDLQTFASVLSEAPKRAFRVELEIMTKGDGTLPVVISLSPLPIGETRAICAVFTDITDQKARLRAEANEHKYRELTQELERSRLELNEKIKDLETFHDVAVDRELKMMQLEKLLKSMQKQALGESTT